MVDPIDLQCKIAPNYEIDAFNLMQKKNPKFHQDNRDDFFSAFNSATDLYAFN